jgi:hypothetical protein
MWDGPLACHARFIGAFFGEADSFYINLSEKCSEESEHGRIVTGVGSDEEFGRICNYIEQNPLKAGLVANAEDHSWSSASARAEQRK